MVIMCHQKHYFLIIMSCSAASVVKGWVVSLPLIRMLGSYPSVAQDVTLSGKGVFPGVIKLL